MTKINKIATSLFVLLFILTFSPHQVYAHLGGVPFLKINGKYSPTNINYFSSPFLKDNIPQDLGAEKYLVDQPINLEIDTKGLPVQKDLIDQAVFRWNWEDGSTAYDFGLKVSHIYNKTGSHLVSLDIKAPNEDIFTPYDTIQLDVVANLNYQLPTAVIYVNAQDFKSGKPINFESQFNTNPEVKMADYYWFVEGKRVSNSRSFDHIFNDKDFFQLVFLKFTDEKGFSAYRGAWLEGTDSGIKLNFPPNSHDEVVIGNKTTEQSQNKISGGNNLLLYGFIAVVIGLGGFLVVKQKPK